MARAILRRALHLAGAACLFLLGADAISLASRAWLFLPLGAMALAILWAIASAILLASPGGFVHAHRKQLALLTGSITFAVLVALVIAAKVRMGPTAAYRREHFIPSSVAQPQQADPEIGWAPSGPPEIVGERLEKLDPSRPQVLLLGDSILYGTRVEKEQTAAFLMSRAIHTHQVVNLSVSGYSVEQYWLYLRRVLPRTRPKLLMMGIFTGNDYQLTGRELTPWGHSKPLFHVEDGKLVRVNEAEDCIDGLSQSLLFRPLWRDKERALALSQVLCAPRELSAGELEMTLRALFREIEALGKSAGARVTFVLLPNRHEVDVYSPAETFYVSKYRSLKRLLEEGGQEVVDIYPALLQHPKSELDRAFQSDSSHFTPEGHAMVAEILLKSIEEKGYLR
ncbi:MAG: SGNH/GDSL hydrolase family protein [Byssovorax sp.]